MTHWSSRLLGAELRLSNVTIAKVWRKWKLQPWRSETLTVFIDPELNAKVGDVVVLYWTRRTRRLCYTWTRRARRKRRTAPHRADPAATAGDFGEAGPQLQANGTTRPLNTFTGHCQDNRAPLKIVAICRGACVGCEVGTL